MHPSFQSVYQHQAFPPVIGVSLLAILLDKTPATIHADRHRAPHKLPPACTPPDCQKPLWVVEDVVAWLRNYQENPATPPSAPKPKSGRPTKAQQVRKARAAAGEVA